MVLRRRPNEPRGRVQQLTRIDEARPREIVMIDLLLNPSFDVQRPSLNPQSRGRGAGSRFTVSADLEIRRVLETVIRRWRKLEKAPFESPAASALSARETDLDHFVPC